jgi:5-methylcytosine-specific restriction endonuclease McrA
MICCKCGADKPQTEFPVGRTECKPCKVAIGARNKRLRKVRDPEYRNLLNRQGREWKAKNRHKVRAWKKASASERIAKKLRKRKGRTSSNALGRGVTRHCLSLLVLQRGRCAVCRVDLGRGKHLDHVIPLAAGGRHEVGNFQWLCPSCNLAKSAKHPVEFMQSRGFLL